ncbi:ABC-type transport auxiliary lipoprotein family protein [Polaromonas sp. UBA4122]|uniref:ABC-type transport auxiliary lipoprotein family protein n=1 Tax=Polaromonas sp. UBA4122 TaxID=1947074 RepID=UPI0025D241DE|nr:ABC-type transport auxiliary lipoprotein family protein [Polaromonas sp. UBA4122]
MMRHSLNCLQSAINSIAARARQYLTTAIFPLIISVGALSGCALPDKPTRATMYDFGPGTLLTQPATRQLTVPSLPPLAIDDIATSGGALDNMAVLYRLGYADAQQLRPYAQARWSMPPAQLVRQRLREQLSQRRAVFNARERVALNRSQNAVLPLLLRLELEEFSQLFTTPDASVGLIRLRATLLEITPAGEKLLGQRNVVVQRPATSADAAGGVRALTAATDAAIEELDQWLQQAPAR